MKGGMALTFALILASFARHTVGDAVGLSYPDTKLMGMTGFARKGGTVGGSNGKVVFLQNLQDLKKYITNAVPQTLVVAVDIDAPKRETIFLGSNKSLIGSYKKNVLSNVYFHTAKNSSNIIFQNLYFTHNPKNIDNSDTQLILEFGKRYWVDHCTFDGGHVDKNDLGKLLSIKAVNFVTVSHCKFLHHNYGLILGYPSDNPTGTENYKNLPQLTMMFNFFDDINARAPGLMRYGKFHVYNNYIQHCRIGFTISADAQIFSEKNVFTQPRKDSEVLDDKGTGFFKDSGSIDMPKNVKSEKDKWHPSEEYHYNVQTTEYTQQFCIKFAGVQSKKLVFAALDKHS